MGSSMRVQAGRQAGGWVIVRGESGDGGRVGFGITGFGGGERVASTGSQPQAAGVSWGAGRAAK